MFDNRTLNEVESIKNIVNEKDAIVRKYEYINDRINKGIYPMQEHEESPCDYCNNNPKNGGSGICHCILGLKEFNC